MGKYSRYGNDLYTGRKAVDFIGHRRVWYTISLVAVGIAIAVIFGKGLNFGIEFTGGTQFTVNLATDDVSQTNADELRDTIGNSGIAGAESPTVTTAGDESILIQVEEMDADRTEAVTAVIEDTVPAEGVSTQEIGASWGQEVAERALIGVGVFLILVMLFIWIYFKEWKMSVAAMVALFHDIAITVGIYALSGFPVTPSAVTGLLAILGFSLYDTVVVFDKVRENTHELLQPNQTYAEAANLAVNQTLVRSINTGIVALIPIGAILYVSAVQLGASSLQDLALSQFVGMAVGIYSSVLVAPRVLVHLKSSEKDVLLADRRARARSKRMAADRYAAVPSFTDDLPVVDEPGTDLDREPTADAEPVSAPPRRPEASGRGRVVPEAHRPVRESGASGRTQPTRQPRSRRGKK